VSASRTTWTWNRGACVADRSGSGLIVSVNAAGATPVRTGAPPSAHWIARTTCSK
jgi:hypothetical protein